VTKLPKPWTTGSFAGKMRELAQKTAANIPLAETIPVEPVSAPMPARRGRQKKGEWQEDPKLSSPCPSCGVRMMFGQCAACLKAKPAPTVEEPRSQPSSCPVGKAPWDKPPRGGDRGPV